MPRAHACLSVFAYTDTVDVQLQVDEDKKNFERLQDLVDKLQNKLKVQKKQIDEAVSALRVSQ